MAGYKTTIKEYKPKLLLTFDGDSFDEFAKTFNSVPIELIDEADNEVENQIVMTANTKGYRAGMPSLVELDKFDQHSCSFGYYGMVNKDWPKAIIEVPHNVNFEFHKRGEFSVAFWHRVDSKTDSYYRKTEKENNPRAEYASFYRPIARKTGVFEFRHWYPWTGQRQLQVWVPGRVENERWLTYDLPSDYYDTDRFIVLTWAAHEGDTGDKYCTAKLYVDNMVVAERTWQYYDEFPTTAVPTNLFIGGVPEKFDDFHSDRNTSNYQIDQFSVFDFALSQHQIGRLMKKAFSFERFLKVDRPERIYPFKDPETPNNYSVTELLGNNDAKCVGGALKVSRGQEGPEMVPQSLSTYLHSGGQVVFRSQNYESYYSPINSSEYTLAVFFKIDSTQPGVFLTGANLEYPFNGLTVLFNVHDNQYRNGSIQIQDSAEEFKSVGGQWNDGKWHHMACVKRGEYLELWLDGQMATKVKVKKKTYSNVMTLFGALPGRQGSNGAVSYMVIYRKALQEQQIAAFASYTKIFRVRGQVTLRGIPIDAWVKFYSTFNGELITSLYSDSVTGEYSVDLYDNRKVDIVVSRPNDAGVRYRVYGPVIPSEYPDPNTD